MPHVNSFRFDPSLGFLPQQHTCVAEALGVWIRRVLGKRLESSRCLFGWGEILLVSPSSIVSLVAVLLGMRGGNSCAAPLLKGT